MSNTENISHQEKTVYEEKQYLGFNKFSLLRRTVLALFCFLIYFLADEIPQIKKVNEEMSGDPIKLLFFLGVFTMVLSVALTWVLHLHTKVNESSVVLDGLWTTRKVKIDLSTIKNVKKVNYSKHLLNPPVYNLHRRGYILFFCRGNDAVQLTDKDGLKYRIGTQKPDEFFAAVEKLISKS